MKCTLKVTAATLSLSAFLIAPSACAEDTTQKVYQDQAENEMADTDNISPPQTMDDPVAAAPADIVDTAAAAGTFTTLLQALQATSLEETLRAAGPFTILAPTDEAFAKLDPATLEALMQPDNVDQLKAVLTYHVIPGKIMAADLSDGQTLATANGTNVTISMAEGPKANDSFISQADIETSNGVIHVIDAVLIPEKPQN